MNSRSLFPVLCLAALLPSCSTFRRALDPIKIDLADAEAPGFFDIGAGFGLVRNVAGESSGDASGILVSFKAYPWGRWYGEAKQSKRFEGVTTNDKNAIEQLIKGKEGGGAAYLTGAGAQLRSHVQSIIDDRSAKLGSDTTLALTRLVDTNVASVSVADQATLKTVVDAPTSSRKWRVIRERDNWYNRFSVFYGTSAGEFSGGGLESSVNALGLGYDISPDLALHMGYAFYDFEQGGSTDSDSSFFYGVSLNLFAFKNFLAAAAGLDS